MLALTLLLGGCAPSEAVLLERALSAPDYGAAVAGCNALEGVRADRCRVEVAALHGHDELAACALVEDPMWKDECVFQLAERLASRGEAGTAFELCSHTRFSRECSYHLLREVARGVLDRSPAEAAAALGPWRSVKGVGDASRLFWKAWFREGRAKGRRVSAEDCPEPECVDAARETLFESLRALHRADPAGFCARPPDAVEGWVWAGQAPEWSARWVADACARDASPSPRAIPPPP